MKQINPRFPIAEHLVEHFSAGCSSVCDQPNIDPSIKTACDDGSQAYCSSVDNISNNECRTYLDRVIRTLTAQRVNTPYSNSVSIASSSGKSIIDYYNALGDSADQYVARNLNNLSSNDVSSLMAVVQLDTDMYNKIFNNIMEATNGDAIMSEAVWIRKPLEKNIISLAEDMNNLTMEQTLINLATISIPFYTKVHTLFGPVHTLLLSRIQTSHLTDPTLLTMRGISPQFRIGMDLFVINQILTTEITSIPTNQNGDYTINISRLPLLYNLAIRQFYKTIASNTNDKLVQLITQADTENIRRCATVNPFSDATCIAMLATGETDLVQAVANANASYCMQKTNIVQDQCIDYVNNKIEFKDEPAAYMLALEAATKPDGTLDKSILDKYVKIKNWLISKTSDRVSTGADGKTVILSACGQPDGLPIATCMQICKTYPELCISDQVQRCQRPEFRYRAEGFSSCNQCAPDNDSTISYILFFLIILLFASLCIIRIRRACRDNETQLHETPSNRQDSVDSVDSV